MQDCKHSNNNFQNKSFQSSVDAPNISRRLPGPDHSSAGYERQDIMQLDRFINRPVLSTVISVVIVILGILGLVSLPVSQYPDIAPPTIQVSTTYTGANAQTVLNSVIAPLEEQINGVENMDYMSSTATNTGSASINITFKQGTDPTWLP